MLGLGHRRSAPVDAGGEESHGGALADLVSTWSEAVVSTGWLAPGDWWHPTVEAVAAAVLTGGDPRPALARLGGARAQAGVGMAEALDDVEGLFRAVGVPTPPYDVVRCFVEAYADGLLGEMTLDACEDPLTGLTTTDYLRARLAEEYREADRDGATVADRSALVVVDTPAQGRGPLVAAVGMIEVADAMRAVFSGGETCAALTPWRAAALVRRQPGLARAAVLLQEMLDARRPRLSAARTWIEGLPAHDCAAAGLLVELAR